jgi:malonyl-CoA decarboxylase
MTDTRTPVEDTGAFRASRRPSGFGRILDSIIDAGRDLLSRTHLGTDNADGPAEKLVMQCRVLLDHRGEASGLALADEILRDYPALSPDERISLFQQLSEQFGPDPKTIGDAADAYRANPEFATLSALSKAVEAPRRKLLRRLNMAPGGTSRLVNLRGDLLGLLDTHPELKPLESDLRHLLIAWFNRGFLVMARIDWNSSANVLEKIVNYEAVHEINGLDDLRTRLADDRRCFAFFHPAMPDDPLIFVQVALSNSVADSIEPLISDSREIGSAKEADTAIFYSISNCHDGLRGISFGNFLIKQVIDELRRDLENIEHLFTLSPVPGLCRWITSVSLEGMSERLEQDIFAAREMLTGDPESSGLTQFSEHAQAILMRLCAHYLLNAKQNGEPVDPVARFHLGNGAELERINWEADSSPAGRERSAGIMVNYVYRLKDIERNHERYFADGEVVASSAVRKLAQSR